MTSFGAGHTEMASNGEDAIELVASRRSDRDRIRIGARREPDVMLHGDTGTYRQVSFRSGSTGLGLLFSSTIAAMHTHQGKTGYITTTNDGIDGGGRFTLYLP